MIRKSHNTFRRSANSNSASDPASLTSSSPCSSRTIPSLRDSLPEGYKSVETRSLVPNAIDGLATGSEFMSRLPEFDTEFDTLRTEAQKEGKVLRYVGVIDVEKGIIKASLEKSVFVFGSSNNLTN